MCVVWGCDVWGYITVEPLLTAMHPWIKANCDINGQAPRSQMNSFCTKQPLNKGHPYITAKMLFPKGGRYRGAPLYYKWVLERPNK